MDEAESDVSQRKAYFAALRQWLQQAQIHNNFLACFPYYMLSLQRADSGSAESVLLNNNWLANLSVGAGPRPPPAPQPPPAQQRLDDNPTEAEEALVRHGGYMYVVAPLYKRLIAELIDCVMLFMLKLAVTYVAVDYFNFIDVESFDFDALTKHFEDYKQAMEITSEIIVLECIYRLLVCIYEAVCLWAGGATPGKSVMGLRVVSARTVVATVAGRRRFAIVYPGREVNFIAAFCRSLIKNLLIWLLLPFFVLLFIFHNNRMGYDVLCGVIVVEENIIPPRRNRP